jgi:hypothetical protein
MSALETTKTLILRSGDAASRRMKAPIVASWFETAQERLLTMRGNTKLGSHATNKKRRPAEAGLETIDKTKTDQAVLL